MTKSNNKTYTNEVKREATKLALESLSIRWMLAVVIDLHSRTVIGWSMESKKTRALFVMRKRPGKHTF